MEITIQNRGCGTCIFTPFGDHLAGQKNRDVAQVDFRIFIIDDPLDRFFMFRIRGTPKQGNNNPLHSPINQVLQPGQYFFIGQRPHNLPEHVHALTEADHHIPWNQAFRHLRLGDAALLPDREPVSPGPAVANEQHILVSAGRDQPQTGAGALQKCV